MKKRKWAKEIISVSVAVVLIIVSTIVSGHAEVGNGNTTDETSVTANVGVDLSGKIFDCNYAVPHTHVDSCYDTEGTLVCGMADYFLHTHDSFCYDSDGVLVCTLDEVEGETHTHDASCYANAQVAALDTADVTAINDNQAGTHEHTADCYTVEKVVTCGLIEDGHTHTMDCYELICNEPDGTHVHDDSCYELVPDESTKTEISRKLICGHEVGHTHTDSCWSSEDTTSENTEKKLDCV